MFEFFPTMTLKNPHDVYQLLELGNSRPVTSFLKSVVAPSFAEALNALIDKH